MLTDAEEAQDLEMENGVEVAYVEEEKDSELVWI